MKKMKSEIMLEKMREKERFEKEFASDFDPVFAMTAISLMSKYKGKKKKGGGKK